MPVSAPATPPQQRPEVIAPFKDAADALSAAVRQQYGAQTFFGMEKEFVASRFSQLMGEHGLFRQPLVYEYLAYKEDPEVANLLRHQLNQEVASLRSVHNNVGRVRLDGRRFQQEYPHNFREARERLRHQLEQERATAAGYAENGFDSAPDNAVEQELGTLWALAQHITDREQAVMMLPHFAQSHYDNAVATASYGNASELLPADREAEQPMTRLEYFEKLQQRYYELHEMHDAGELSWEELKERRAAISDEMAWLDTQGLMAYLWMDHVIQGRGNIPLNPKALEKLMEEGWENLSPEELEARLAWDYQERGIPVLRAHYANMAASLAEAADIDLPEPGTEAYDVLRHITRLEADVSARLHQPAFQPGLAALQDYYQDKSDYLLSAADAVTDKRFYFRQTVHGLEDELHRAEIRTAMHLREGAEPSQFETFFRQVWEAAEEGQFTDQFDTIWFNLQVAARRHHDARNQLFGSVYGPTAKENKIMYRDEAPTMPLGESNRTMLGHMLAVSATDNPQDDLAVVTTLSENIQGGNLAQIPEEALVAYLHASARTMEDRFLEEVLERLPEWVKVYKVTNEGARGYEIVMDVMPDDMAADAMVVLNQTIQEVAEEERFSHLYITDKTFDSGMPLANGLHVHFSTKFGEEIRPYGDGLPSRFALKRMLFDLQHALDDVLMDRDEAETTMRRILAISSGSQTIVGIEQTGESKDMFGLDRYQIRQVMLRLTSSPVWHGELRSPAGGAHPQIVRANVMATELAFLDEHSVDLLNEAMRIAGRDDRVITHDPDSEQAPQEIRAQLQENLAILQDEIADKNQDIIHFLDSQLAAHDHTLENVLHQLPPAREAWLERVSAAIARGAIRPGEVDRMVTHYVDQAQTERGQPVPDVMRAELQKPGAAPDDPPVEHLSRVSFEEAIEMFEQSPLIATYLGEAAQTALAAAAREFHRHQAVHQETGERSVAV